ncbi:MAG: manganese-binding transcriptional regulator MntR [Phycisphaerales bacterium JB040]
MPRRASDPERFEATRAAHALEVAEDYVEAIAELIERRGVARVTHLAEMLGVSHVTVNRTVTRLERDGLVRTEPYQPIVLTVKGERMAAHARERHEIVVAFLRAAGVSEGQAEVDAEGIEHHCSTETLEALASLTRRLARDR